MLGRYDAGCKGEDYAPASYMTLPPGSPPLSPEVSWTERGTSPVGLGQQGRSCSSWPVLPPADRPKPPAGVGRAEQWQGEEL